MIFDTHAHLEDEKFDPDRQEVIHRMRKNGITRCLLVADGKKFPQTSYDLAMQNDWIYWAVGIHPHDAAAYTLERASRLREYLQMPKLVALGEIGLDYHYDTEPRPIQRAAFDAQMELAYEMKKPVILHIREAHGDATGMMIERVRRGRMPSGVMHCYTGSWESAKKYLEMGLYISFSGRWPEICPWSGCWWRRIAPIWRRCPCGAGATNRPLCAIPPTGSRNFGESPRKRCMRPPWRTEKGFLGFGEYGCHGAQKMIQYPISRRARFRPPSMPDPYTGLHTRDRQTVAGE